MGEAPERFEDDGGERPRDTLDDFRKEIQAESEGEGPPGQEGTEESHGEPVTTAQGDGGQEAADHVADEDLESFRKEVVEEYGPEGHDARPLGALKEDIGDEEEAGQRAEDRGEQGEPIGSGGGETGKAPDTTDDSDNQSLPRNEKEAGSGAAGADGDKVGSSEDESAPVKSEGASSEVPETGNQEAIGKDDEQTTAVTSEQQGAEETGKGTAPKDKASEEGESPVERGKANQPELDGEADEADKKPPELKVEEAETAPAELESYSRNANQIMVSVHGRPGDFEGTSSTEVETWDFRRFPTEIQPTQGAETRAGRSVNDGKDLADLEAPNQPRPDSPEGESDNEWITTQTALKGTLPERGIIREGDQSATEVGRYSRNDNQILVTEQGRLEHGDDVRVFEVVDYGKGANVRFPVSDLEEKGAQLERGENAVVGLRLKGVEKDETEIVFARFVARDRRAEAYVGGIGGEKGSRYELLEAWKVDEDKLVGEFERGKCEHLENVRLEHADEKMFVNIDGRRVELKDCRLSTRGSHAALRGRLDGDVNCVVEFDGWRASVRSGRDYPVEGMKMEGDNLVVRYVQSRNEVHERRMPLDHSRSGDGRLSLRQLQKPETLQLVKLLDAPEGTDGVYTFAVDKRLEESVRLILDEAMKEGPRRYEAVKGEVGESLISKLLALADWEKIERHPFNETRKDGVHGRGADHIFRDPDRALSISESKFWGQVESALKRGEIQMGVYYDRQQKYHGQQIERGYVMAMDWQLNGDPIQIHVKRVRPRVNSSA